MLFLIASLARNTNRYYASTKISETCRKSTREYSKELFCMDFVLFYINVEKINSHFFDIKESFEQLSNKHLKIHSLFLKLTLSHLGTH